MERLEGVLARLPMAWRRGVLRVLFSLGRRLPFFRPDPAEVGLIARVLRVPVRRARRIVSDGIYQDLLYSLEMLALSRRDPDKLLRDARRVRVSDAAPFEWAAGERSMILATMHFGVYPIAIAYLLITYFKGRPVAVIKRSTPGAEEQIAVDRLRRFGIEVSVYTIEGDSDWITLARDIRRGTLLIMLVDLPSSYGRNAEVDLLWQPARIATGITELAALCRAPALFFTVTSDGARDVIRPGEILTFGRLGPEQRGEAAQQVADFVSRHIRERPDHWHFWSRLNEFVDESRMIA